MVRTGTRSGARGTKAASHPERNILLPSYPLFTNRNLLSPRSQDRDPKNDPMGSYSSRGYSGVEDQLVEGARVSPSIEYVLCIPTAAATMSFRGEGRRCPSLPLRRVPVTIR